MSETITVSGNGEVTAEPEAADVTADITVEDDDANNVRNELASRHDAVEAALQQDGFADEDIVSQDYSVRYRQARDDNEEGVYVGTHSLQVSVDDIDEVGSVIDTAVEAGATEVSDVTFRLSDDTRRQCRDEAIHLAVAEARQDASAAAEATGRSLGAIHELNVDRARVHPSRQTGEAVALAATVDTVDTSINSGDVGVDASVTITYELRHK